MNKRWANVVLAIWIALILLMLSPLVLGWGSGTIAGADTSLSAERLVRLTGNSLILSAGAAALAMLVAVPVAVGAVRLSRRRTGSVLLAVACVPLFVPPPVLAVAAIRLLGPAGFLTKWFTGNVATFPVTEQIMGPAPKIPGAPIYTLAGGAFSLAWGLYPLAVLAIASALARRQSSAEEAALLETGPFAVLRRITLPLASGGIAVGACLVFLFAMTEFGVPESLRSLPVLVSEVYAQAGVFFDMKMALAAALTVLAVAAVAIGAVALVFRWAGLAGNESTETDNTDGGGQIARLPGLRAARVMAWVLGVLPAAAIVGLLLATANGPHGPWPVWKTTWQTAHDEVWFTIRLGLALALLAALVGSLLGSVLANLRKPWIGRLLIAAPLVIPGPVFGVAVQVLLRRPPGSLPFGFDDVLANFALTHGPLLVVWTVRFAPVVALLVERLLRAIPREEWEIAALEGGGWLARWHNVAWPHVWPGVAGGAMIAFALCLGEVGAAILLMPPGTTTLGVRLLTLMHYAPTGQVSALCLLVLMPGVVAYLIGAALLALKTRKQSFNEREVG